jgi:hypothetical protein
MHGFGSEIFMFKEQSPPELLDSTSHRLAANIFQVPQGFKNVV